MMTALTTASWLILGGILFILTGWLGFYLLVRPFEKRWIRWLGWVLLGYAGLIPGLLVSDSVWRWPLLVFGVLSWLVDLLLAWRGVLAVGEAFGRDAGRSLLGAGLMAIIFALPVVVIMLIATGPTPAMQLLFFLIMGLAVATQVLADPIQAGLDRLVFRHAPGLQQERATLRATAEALPKRDETFDLAALDEAEFARLTRRALSAYGDLPRLAASPLTRLPVLEARLAARQAPDHTLERAAELKQLLYEAILQLRPAAGCEFSSADAWRHYNALYYPYVIGLRPYSRRADHDQLDPASRQALDWLRTQVPERSLHNWQNAAARLVAQYLREASRASE
jgi:hypothetical protein